MINIDSIVGSVLVIFSMSFYHVIYASIDNLRIKTPERLKHLKVIELFIVYNICSYVVSSYFNIMFVHVTTNLYYTLIVVIFYLMDKRLTVYGLTVSLFLTEFWEIPVYVWRFMNTDDFLTMNGTKQVVVLLTILMKLSVILYLLYEIEILKWSKKDFLKMIVSFSIIYSVGAYVVLDMINSGVFHTSYIGWYMRFLVLGVFILYTKIQMLKYPIGSLKAVVIKY